MYLPSEIACSLFFVLFSTFDLCFAEFLPNIGDLTRRDHSNETREREYRLPANSFPPFHLALVVTSIAVLFIAVLGAVCLYVRALQLSRKNPTIRITISDSKHSAKSYQDAEDV